MKQTTLRLGDELYKKLAKEAEKNHRSLNAQINYLLDTVRQKTIEEFQNGKVQEGHEVE